MVDSDLRRRHEKSLNYMFTRVPFVTRLGMELVDWETEGIVVVRMPFVEFADNGSKTPHGGAIATLIDTTGSAAVWNGHDYERGTRGSTVSIALNYVGAPRDEAMRATGRCVRRAKELNFATVEVQTESGRPVADAVMTYRIVP